MYSYFSGFVTRHWLCTILAWLAVAGAVHFSAPSWDTVTYDGDLAFLPADRPSVRGEALAQAAFPQTRAKSEIVLIVEQEDRTLDSSDLRVADLLASRFHNRLGAAEFRRGEDLWAKAEDASRKGPSSEADEYREAARAAWKSASEAWDEALRRNEEFAEALHNSALAYERLGQDSEAAMGRESAWALDPTLRQHAGEIWPPDAGDLPLVEVWDRHHPVFRTKLRSADRKAQLIVLHLTNEFMATDNIRVLEIVEQEVASQRREVNNRGLTGLTLGITGSAAVGGDMLRAAAESIRHTELLTILLVIVILLAVYRAPFLILVPLITIAVSLTVSTGFLAMLAQLAHVPGFSWWEFKIFKTTRIFIVVILFGSGTDFCLFLIARLREELARHQNLPNAVEAALTKVGNALVASALTTILGLAMMFFAEFGKFRNSGPAIGLCLLTTLIACLTLSPALLSALGRLVFWPSFAGDGAAHGNRSDDYWRKISRWVVRRPVWILLVCVFALAPLAYWGWDVPQRVTFDLLSELPPDRTTMQGNELLQRHFPIGEGGPIIVLAHKPGAKLDDPEPDVAASNMGAIFDLTKRLTEVPGVHSVRSIAEPLGDPPEKISLITSPGKLFLRRHPVTKAMYLSQVEPYRGEIARFELVLNDNPFSLAAIQTLSRVDEVLRSEAKREGSFWRGAEFVFTGTTAGIRDLREVIQSDYWRITALVTAVVFAVILLVLRRPVICLYLILSVVFSYLVTIGATELVFHWYYGNTFVGLDWKVPIFLFVILVAVGQDYNIYLVTRVLEEQNRRGLFAGLREAMVRTGGIITSCGVIMAGSFVSMISGSLRGIAELGFALTLGILLDTFIVRTVLVPAFLSILASRELVIGRRKHRQTMTESQSEPSGSGAT